jgi:hypothetical protein
MYLREDVNVRVGGESDSLPRFPIRRDYETIEIGSVRERRRHAAAFRGRGGKARAASGRQCTEDEPEDAGNILATTP